MMENAFVRTESLLGEGSIKKLNSSRVIVFGVGGVGGFTVEALARSGVGRIEVVDADIVSVSNLNRQIIATVDTVGKDKVDVIEERIKIINPECQVVKHKTFFLPETADQFDFKSYDFIVDAIDTVSGKIQLAVSAKEAGVEIISAMGAGNKLDPTAFKISDVYDTKVCPLAKVMRRELRKRGVDKLTVVYSEEEPITIGGKQEGAKPVPGSVAFVPSVVGLIIAGHVIKTLVKNK